MTGGQLVQPGARDVLERHLAGQRQPGSARWDGDTAPELEPAPAPAGTDAGPPGIAGALAEFVDALRTGRRPWGEVHDDPGSLAMVHAAVESARSGAPGRGRRRAREGPADQPRVTGRGPSIAVS